MNMVQKNKCLLVVFFMCSLAQAKEQSQSAKPDCVKMRQQIEKEMQEGFAAEKKLTDLAKQIEKNQKYIGESSINCQKQKNCQQMAMQLELVRNQTTLLQGEKITLADKQEAQLKKVESLRAQLKEHCAKDAAQK